MSLLKFDGGGELTEKLAKLYNPLFSPEVDRYLQVRRSVVMLAECSVCSKNFDRNKILGAWH